MDPSSGACEAPNLSASPYGCHPRRAISCLIGISPAPPSPTRLFTARSNSVHNVLQQVKQHQTNAPHPGALQNRGRAASESSNSPRRRPRSCLTGSRQSRKPSRLCLSPPRDLVLQSPEKLEDPTPGISAAVICTPRMQM